MLKKNQEHTNHMNIDEEILLKEYELNMSDHDRKEKMAWLASTLYFTFCLVVISFILGDKNIIRINNELNCLTKWIIIYGVILIIILFIKLFIIIFSCTFLFVWYQYDRKKESDKNIEILQNIFLKLIHKDEIYYKDLKENIYPNINNKNETKYDFTKTITFILLWSFFIVKIIITIIYLFNLIIFPLQKNIINFIF